MPVPVFLLGFCRREIGDGTGIDAGVRAPVVPAAVDFAVVVELAVLAIAANTTVALVKWSHSPGEERCTSLTAEVALAEHLYFSIFNHLVVEECSSTGLSHTSFFGKRRGCGKR